MANFLTNLFNKVFPQKTQTQGSQRPLATIAASTRRNWDLEISEFPIRDPLLARESIELLQYCYEARHCLSCAADDAFASSDGDDIGWTIADTLDDNETKIHPDTKAILLDLIQRQQSHEKLVIGGTRLKKALRSTLGYGDCFLELGFERDGSTYCVAKTLYLPTWEIFRCESDTGVLERFEQRRTLSMSTSPDYQFFPFQIVHFKHEEKVLYGESIFAQSLDAWAKLKDAIADLAAASRDVGQNPNVHTLSEGVTQDQLKEYRFNHENELADGTITNYYLASPETISKVANINPDLKPLIDNVLQWRYRIIPPGFPVWFFPGLDTTGAREISEQPAKKYARCRNSWCGTLSGGIRQTGNTELILRKGYDWFRQNGRYRIAFPIWKVSDTGMSDESNATGISDIEQQKNNKNGHKQRGSSRDFIYF